MTSLSWARILGSVKRTKTQRLLVAIAAAAFLLGILLWCAHTHEDGSPRGRDDCAICQIGIGLTAGLTVIAAVLAVLLSLLARLDVAVQRGQSPPLLVVSCARGPPFPA